MKDYEFDYHELVRNVIRYGDHRTGRNGKTRALFGQHLVIESMEHDLLPILTRRRIRYKGIFGELAAFCRGATKLAEFKALGCNYWDGNAAAWAPNEFRAPEDMEVGQVYGAQWRNWENTGHDQVFQLLVGLWTQPYGRRHVLTTFSPTAQACLPPCHLLAQFFVTQRAEGQGWLDIAVYMRSVDLILGLPSDVLLYAGLLRAVCHATYGLYKPGRIHFFLGDTHVYESHVEQFLEKQYPAQSYQLPQYSWDAPLLMQGLDVFDNFGPGWITPLNYQYSQDLKYELHI
jgi:thymidylate synthase